MPYDQTFYDAYRAELDQPPIRPAHDAMFSIFYRFAGSGCYVLDLGCGTCEFARYAMDHHLAYHGIDLNHVELGMPVALGDYLKGPITCPFKPTVFISVFSTELVLPAPDRNPFYERIFEQFPTIHAAMIAGFYYADRPHDPVVVEAHGFRSHQTIDDLRFSRSRVFREFRTFQNAPSKYFGPDVVEVWKFLERI